jgi:hypothetical protein
MQERFQIYQLTIPELPAGGLENVALPLDSDAPFALRRIRSRNIGLNGWRFQRPDKTYQSSFLRTDWLVPVSSAALPFPTHGMPVYPQEVYPANGQIVVDVGNATGQPITNARLIFYGSKLFADRAIAPQLYPAKMSPLPFINPRTDADGNNAGPLTVPLAASATLPATFRDLQLRIQQDADFAIRYMVADPFNFNVEGGAVPLGDMRFPMSNNYSELYVLLKDQNKKAYMNEPVHINDVFGQAAPANPGAGTDNISVGPAFPGLVTPELIVERQHSLYFDVFRYDLVGFPVDLWFRFHGAKLLPR